MLDTLHLYISLIPIRPLRKNYKINAENMSSFNENINAVEF